MAHCHITSLSARSVMQAKIGSYREAQEKHKAWLCQATMGRDAGLASCGEEKRESADRKRRLAEAQLRKTHAMKRYSAITSMRNGVFATRLSAGGKEGRSQSRFSLANPSRTLRRSQTRMVVFASPTTRSVPSGLKQSGKGR